MDMERLNNANASLLDIITSGDDVGDDHHFTSEIRQLNEAEEQLIDRLHLHDERKFNSSTTVVTDNLCVRDDDIIEINAGGKIIAARRGTLCQLSGTRLETLFSGRWDSKLSRDGNGRIFLDVNPEVFQAIVDYLNEMMISSEDDPSEPPVPPADEDRQVLAQYLELFLLRVPPPQMPDSNIITQYSQVKLLHKWLEEAEGEEEKGEDVELSLIYHSSKENLSNENFHRACDGQGRTLLVIETIEGYIVGGYTNSDWASSEDPMSSVGCWSKANKSFLFALSGFDLASPCKMDLRNKNVKHAIYNCSQYGAAFGGGCQQCDMKVTGSSVFLNTGQVYECGKSDKLCDGHSYLIQEMEVFRVSDVHHHTNHHQYHHKLEGSPKAQVKQFTREVNKAINEKWEALRELEAELCSLEDNFDDEERFINTISSFEKKDIITLNVSGTIMTTTRATLLVTDDSVLARQFDDTKWTEQGECTLIEHSPYCFGKILDYLRLKRFHDQDFIDEPPLPTVHQNQRNRFQKVVRYYFPGESSKFILG